MPRTGPRRQYTGARMSEEQRKSTKVIDFRPERAMDLGRMIEDVPTLVYEAHSTDYQTAANLAALVAGHLARS